MPLAGLGRLPGGYKRGLLITSNSPDLAPLAAQLQQGLHRVQWGPLPPPPDFKRASHRLFTPPVRQSHKTKDLVQTRSFNAGAEHRRLSPVPAQAAPSLPSSVHPKIWGSLCMLIQQGRTLSLSSLGRAGARLLAAYHIFLRPPRFAGSSSCLQGATSRGIEHTAPAEVEGEPRFCTPCAFFLTCTSIISLSPALLISTKRSPGVRLTLP